MGLGFSLYHYAPKSEYLYSHIHFPRLRKLQLAYCGFQKSIYDFVMLRGPKSEELVLRKVKLIQSPWYDVFPDFRGSGLEVHVEQLHCYLPFISLDISGKRRSS